MVPDSAVIVIPPGGGQFTYSAAITNFDTLNSYYIRAWLNVQMPNGFTFYLAGFNFDIQPGAQLSRYPLIQWVPANAPAGTYTYNGYLGNPLTWEIWSHESWTFEKLAGDGLATHNFGWHLFGWQDDLALMALPTEYDMLPNYPNPFNPETEITFMLPEAGKVSLVIYDILGGEVERLVDGYRPAGVYNVTFDGSDLASGVYFAVFRAGDFHKVHKMLMVK
jgi:hypothetical protein